MSRLRLTLLLAVLGAVGVAGLLGYLSRVGNDDARLRELSRVKRLRARLLPYRFSPTYRKIAAVTKVDPERGLSNRVNRLENSLYHSGSLVSLTFWVPNLRLGPKEIQNLVLMTNSPFDQFTLWTFSPDDTVSIMCPREQVASAESVFCCITNRVPWGTLRRLGGSRDDADCRLPDGSIVGLDECQKWLNESVAGGWVVGVTLQSDRPGQSLIAATRKRAEAEAQPGGPANGSQPFGSETHRAPAAAASRR